MKNNKNNQSKKVQNKILSVINDYSRAWMILKKYDDERLTLPKKGVRAKHLLNYDGAQKAISLLKKELAKKEKVPDIFGVERSKKFLEGVIKNVYQTYGKKELYPTLAEKAAHLFYFVVKDHPFIDGNKRLGAFLFIVFLAQNNYLLKKNGEQKINDNALVALTVFLAQSEPKEKDVLIKLIANFLSP